MSWQSDRESKPYLDNDAKALNINVFHSSELYP